MANFLSTDYDNVKKSFKLHFNLDIDPTLDPMFKKLHKTVFSLCNLQYELCKLSSERMHFLMELRSDYVQILVSVALGLKKALMLFERTSIEDTFRHIYYRDHPIEFILLNVSSENRIKTDDLNKYIKTHPLFKKIRGFEGLCDWVIHQYEEKSKHIHGSSVKYLQMSRTISEIKIKEDEINQIIDDIIVLTSHLLALVIIFHRDLFNKINPEQRELILSSVSSEHRRMIHNL